MDLRLQDAMDGAILQRLLDRLYEAMPMKYAIVDLEGRRLAETHGADFCMEFHKSEGPLRDQYYRNIAKQCGNGQEPTVTACPHGLMDCAVPIAMRGRHVASMVFGQFLTERPDESVWQAQAAEYGCDDRAYIEAMRRVPVIDMPKLEHSKAFVRVFAEMVGEMAGRSAGELEARMALEESNRKLQLASAYNRNLIEANADAIAVVGSDGIVIDVNGATERLLDMAREEIIGAAVYASAANPALARAALAKAFRNGGAFDIELEMRHRDGRVIPLLFNAAVFDCESGPKGMLLTIRNLTREIESRKQAEKNLEYSEQRYRGLFDAMAEGVAVHDIIYEDGKAVDYVITDLNQAFVTHTGRAAENMVGMRATQAYGTPTAPYLNIYAEVALTGIPVSFDAYFTPLKKHFRISVFSPRRGQFACVFSDITKLKMAEADLKAAKEYAEEIINTANAMVVVLDMEGRVLEFNRAAEELTGWTRAEILGKSWFETVAPADRFPQTDVLFRRMKGKGLPATYENPILTKSGEERQIVWHNSVVRLDGSNPGMVSFGMDVTERLKMESELRAYRERLDVVFKNLDAIIFQIDGNGVYTLAEGRGLARAGITKQNILGRTTREIPLDDPAHAKAMEKALAGKRATAEFSIRGAVFEEILTPTMGPDGKRDGVIGLAMDVTERFRAEHRIREEKERLKVTLQSIGDGVIATDALGRVTLMNGVAEKLTGWSFRQASGRQFTEVFDIYNEKTGEKCPNPVEKVLTTGNIVGLANHTALRAKNGTVRSIADSAAPILDEAHTILGVILVFRDVTESKKKESEITYLSYHDRLTGLYNRAFLEEESRRLDTARQLPISVIMGDVNGLKLTNDVFGHAEGDNLLLRIAGILRECCRNEDIVARIGGDEFCILLPKTSYAAASDICKRIAAICDKAEYGLPTGGTRLSISLGCATKTGLQEKMVNVMKAAEDSMYRRKLLESRSQHSFLISSIRTTLFEKSFETEQHAQRLISYGKAVAQALNLPDDQINDIELFALLHDIGKIAIDSHILTKPEKLSVEEWEEMHRHPEIGFRIAQASPDLAHIAEYILCHHERWDGAGYPQGLKGTAIPLLARILLVVDAYDAMTQDRVYRKAMSREEACAELLLNAGTQFDPNIVWAFMELLEHDEAAVY